MPTDKNFMDAMLGRISLWILLGGVAGGIVFIASSRTSFGVSFLLGSIAAWGLYAGQVRMVDRMIRKTPGRRAARRVFARYFLILALACAIFALKVFDARGFLCGMLLPAAAVIVECVIYLTGLSRKD